MCADGLPDPEPSNFRMAMEKQIVEESIKQSILKNGFPGKTVRLPFQPVFKSCKDHGKSLKLVLENLEAEKIHGVIEGDFIVFYKPGGTSEKSQTNQTESRFDFSNLNPENLLNIEATAQEQLKNLNPSQKEHIRKMVENLTEEDKAKIMKLFLQTHPPGDTRG